MGIGASKGASKGASNAQSRRYHSDQLPLFKGGMKNRPLPPIPSGSTPSTSPIHRRPADLITPELAALRQQYHEARAARDIKRMGQLSVKIEHQRLQDERDWKFAMLQAQDSTFGPRK